LIPEKRAVFQHICVPLMALGDVLTGVYLMLFAVKTEVRGNQRAATRG
jgi:hypothetical protein